MRSSSYFCTSYCSTNKARKHEENESAPHGNFFADLVSQTRQKGKGVERESESFRQPPLLLLACFFSHRRCKRIRFLWHSHLTHSHTSLYNLQKNVSCVCAHSFETSNEMWAKEKKSSGNSTRRHFFPFFYLFYIHTKYYLLGRRDPSLYSFFSSCNIQKKRSRKNKERRSRFSCCSSHYFNSCKVCVL